MSLATMWLLKFGYALSFVALWMAGYICVKLRFSGSKSIEKTGR